MPDDAIFQRGQSVVAAIYSRPNCLRSSTLAWSRVRRRLADKFLPARLIKKTSIDSAERKNVVLRRWLFSAERLSDFAMRLGSFNLKTRNAEADRLHTRGRTVFCH